MATLYTITVDTDGVSATYSALATAEATELAGSGQLTSGNLVGNDEAALFTCAASGSSADGVAKFDDDDGWTTGDGNNIEVRGDNSTGIWDASKYWIQKAANWTAGLEFEQCNYSVIDRVQVDGNAKTSGSGIYLQNAINCTIKKCIAKNVPTATTYAGIHFAPTAGTNLVHSCVVYDCGTGVCFPNNADGNLTMSIIEGCTNGISAVGPTGTPEVTGCAIWNNADDILDGNAVLVMDYLATDDGGGGNPVAPLGANWDNEFDNIAANIYTIKSGGNCFEACAITNADNSDVPTEDIAGNARETGAGTSTCIGAFANGEVAAGGLSIPVAIHHILRH